MVIQSRAHGGGQGDGIRLVMKMMGDLLYNYSWTFRGLGYTGWGRGIKVRCIIDPPPNLGVFTVQGGYLDFSASRFTAAFLNHDLDLLISLACLCLLFPPFSLSWLVGSRVGHLLVSVIGGFWMIVVCIHAFLSSSSWTFRPLMTHLVEAAPLRPHGAAAAQLVAAFSVDLLAALQTMAHDINRRSRISETTYPNHLDAHFGDGLVLSQRDVGQQWRVPGDARVCVAVDVGLPLPAGCVRVSRADVLGLEALEFLLVAEFVGLLGRRKISICRYGFNLNGVRTILDVFWI